MLSDHDDEFENIAQQVMTDVALDAFAESTVSMGRMLEIVVDMSAQISKRAHDHAVTVSESSADDVYVMIFESVWNRTMETMYEASRRAEQMQAFMDLMQDRGNSDDV